MAVNSRRYMPVRNDLCINCGFCENYIDCPAKTGECIGCGACVISCPQSACSIKSIIIEKPTGESDNSYLINFYVNGNAHKVWAPISVSSALRQIRGERKAAGTDVDVERSGVTCNTGGCWNCEILVNGILIRGCITPLQDGMEIVTKPEALHDVQPKRVVTVMRPPPHRHPSIFTHGCNYRCDACHNWDFTFSSKASALTPKQTIAQLGLRTDTDRWIGISGGEPTLNRRWLVATIRELRQAAPESRIQLDTNASILTPDYIDELVTVGITDVSPDFKAHKLETFMKVSGIHNRNDADTYMQTTWQAISYLHHQYADKVFMAVSIPCHPYIHSRSELKEMAVALKALDPNIPVTLIELQPAFRVRDWPVLDPRIMEEAKRFFLEEGLKRVITQGGPNIPRPVEPSQLALSVEDF